MQLVFHFEPSADKESSDFLSNQASLNTQSPFPSLLKMEDTVGGINKGFILCSTHKAKKEGTGLPDLDF